MSIISDRRNSMGKIRRSLVVKTVKVCPVSNKMKHTPEVTDRPITYPAFHSYITLPKSLAIAPDVNSPTSRIVPMQSTAAEHFFIDTPASQGEGQSAVR